MKIRAFSLMILFLAVAQAGLAGTDLQSDMQEQLKDKIVYIRGFYRGKKLVYDVNGDPKGAPEKGVWTFEGRLQIKQVKIEKNRCVIEGDRLATIFDHKNKEMKYASNYATTIEIELAAGDTEPNLIKALQEIFMSPGEKFTNIVPAYWRFFLEHPFAENPPAGQDPSGVRIADPTRSGWKEAVPMGVPEVRPKEDAAHGPDYYLEDGTPVFRATGQNTPMFYSYSPKAKKRMTPPRVIHAPDPKYPENMGKVSMQGFTIFWAIIGTSGDVQELQVLHPAGFGFDDAAADAIQKWKFKPAKLDELPVPVQIKIEVHFEHY